ncbi:ribosomal-protein-alanine N-acetyltransferase [Rhodoblastus sphagnicola]|uniref:Ribosomal-protein-alanine N-acetyltransferase n=1 Tax=Rhodoblastus sphagnicola TaxID=333368 RepID=A0A2S6MUD1_9HYPH|nr:ribosomal protein S18-alanine N-acetyltransferase [Rhodoblastus sphagnicola]MBB4197024.1 ribosomal-protein-alanine N-acetyltransferase [Rhodoblastus sphagnicola]PPQ25973.1 ribosomal-protein-alanine N-acetyltransferase [Rhodoblastus sphagnicola]
MKIPELLRKKPEFSLPRLLKVGDASDCSSLHATGFAHPWSASEFEALLADPSCLSVGVALKSELAGYLMSRVASDEAEVLTIVVAPTLRTFGCAQRLLLDHLSRLAARGVTVVFLEVDAENEAAMALYRRNGFVEVGRRKAYYARAEGARGDALVMRRNLG